MQVQDWMIADIVGIRRSRLRLWFSDKSIPESEKSYISQLINGNASFGEKAARRLKKTYKMPDRYLDNDAFIKIDHANMAIEKKPHRNKKFNKLLVEQFKGVQVAMANALGISPSLISRYASGSKGIGEDMKTLIEEKLNLQRGWFDQDENAEQPMIDLSNISLEKMQFMKEIVAMDEEEFHAKIGVFKAVAAVPTKKESNHDD